MRCTGPIVPLLILLVMLEMFWLVASSCEPLIASVELALISPAATLMIFWLPASIPLMVTLGPPEMVRPLVSIMVLPVITELNSGFSAISSCRLPLASTSVRRLAPE
ncbi:hypothetical protein D3C80_1246400 [compost metagenome]